MNVKVFCAALALGSAFLLQGCFSPTTIHNNSEGTKKAVSTSKEEASARCVEGKFSCKSKASPDYDSKKWCDKMRAKCAGGTAAGGGSAAAPTSCIPRCTWECQSQKCDQVCAPKCAQALCSTRCTGFNTDSCQMKCGKPNCRTICPKKACPAGGDCPACKTECGKPVCKMQCGNDEQNCRHICARPNCKWFCKKPQECPRPQCRMKCEKAKCTDNSPMLTRLPPLQPGETEVTAFTSPMAGPAPSAAPAPAPALLQSATSAFHRVSSMRVNITTMGEDHSLYTDEVELKLKDVTTVSFVAWTSTLRNYHGQVQEHEASCDNGRFQCNGDDAWCMEQKSHVCKEVFVAERDAQTEDAEAGEIALQPSETVEISEAPDVMVENAVDVETAAVDRHRRELELGFMQRRSNWQSSLQP